MSHLIPHQHWPLNVKSGQKIFFFNLCFTLCAILLLGWRLADAEIFCDDVSKRYHTADCPERTSISKRYLRVFESVPEAESRGYYPCPTCNPPVTQETLSTAKKRQLSLPVERVKEYIGDSETQRYHYDWCPQVKAMLLQNQVIFSNIQQAKKKKYLPCEECHPPVLAEKIDYQAFVDKSTSITATAPKPPLPPGSSQAEVSPPGPPVAAGQEALPNESPDMP